MEPPSEDEHIPKEREFAPSTRLDPDGSDLSDFVFRARMRYLATADQVCQERLDRGVLESLRDDVFPHRGNTPVFAKAMATWAKNFRFRDFWIMQAAGHTMQFWQDARTPEVLEWEPSSILAALQFPGPGNLVFDFTAYRREGESLEKMERRLKDEFDEALTAYLGSFLEMDATFPLPSLFRRGREDRDAEVYLKWCALHQCVRLTYDEVAKIYDVTDKDVGSRVREVAQEIRLTLPGRGSGRRAFKQRNASWVKDLKR